MKNEEKIILNKYGRARLRYLKECKKSVSLGRSNELYKKYGRRNNIY